MKQVTGGKIGRVKKKRESLLTNLASSLILYEKATTTLAKAKLVLPIVERLTHRAKTPSLVTKQYLMKRLFSNQLLVKKLTKEIAPRYAKKTGGYLRIIKLSSRPGDRAKMARIEFV
ncbi:50S ribosomal protein L17 [candidate division Kazan bacterium RIFCSPHIGHO2_01_FULL_49_10]|uniref:50S ribosomal protein L17 n=1 Tax=candidate division Kazan bacterium RIFCSPLOWO2_01_FULL_48_13 TaxID=1798539 RepID=A0A1F4PP52_UNCK3|nr:MAG: 50S ribosomal protein L17 [candidate division Kazan bacterium RIFCSPHIGHO2_01_FULL_49_10]OGB85633.1 MAG: 50S ribosomal protein L17 [candidate division Kazan bacterium RIFCSPLOWO2_01_FULL_48_13]